MPKVADIKKMRMAMEVCGVAPTLIDQVVKSVSTEELFALTTVSAVTSRDANRFFTDIFWPEYPKRDGGNPKEPARKKIVAAVISGENPDLILAGVRRLKHGLAARNKIGTEFVPMAITWINRRGWDDDPQGEPRAMNNGGGQQGFYSAAASIRAKGQ